MIDHSVFGDLPHYPFSGTKKSHKPTKGSKEESKI